LSLTAYDAGNTIDVWAELNALEIFDKVKNLLKKAIYK
jgi:hypothetical protein